MTILNIDGVIEARNKRTLFDSICLIQSWGKEFPLVSYDGLGLGNLLAAYIGGLLIDEDIDILHFYDIRIAPYQWLIRKPKYWYYRSSFKIWNLTNNLRRVFYNPRVTNQTFIDIDRRVLYLSTDLVNSDKNYFKNIFHLNKDKIQKKLERNFGLKYKNNDDYGSELRILGVHIRQGDFQKNTSDSSKYRSNVKTSLIQYIDGISSILKIYDCNIVRIFSDEPIKKYERNKINETVFSLKKNIRIEFQTEASAVKAINKMMECNFLLISNSTFSFWAAALKGIKTFYLLDSLPYSGKYFNNMTNINSLKRNNG